jgi:hypothetical protein
LNGPIKYEVLYEEESQIEVCYRCPREYELDLSDGQLVPINDAPLRDTDCVVDELNLQGDLPEETLTRRPYTVPEDGCMNRSEERPVEPTAALRDELSVIVSNIRDHDFTMVD